MSHGWVGFEPHTSALSRLMYHCTTAADIFPLQLYQLTSNDCIPQRSSMLSAHNKTTVPHTAYLENK